MDVYVVSGFGHYNCFVSFTIKKQKKISSTESAKYLGAFGVLGNSLKCLRTGHAWSVQTIQVVAFLLQLRRSEAASISAATGLAVRPPIMLLVQLVQVAKPPSPVALL